MSLRCPYICQAMAVVPPILTHLDDLLRRLGDNQERILQDIAEITRDQADMMMLMEDIKEELGVMIFM